MKEILRTLPKRLYWVAGAIIAAPIIVYAICFPSGKPDQAAFGTFGDYMNPFLSLVNIILLGYITILINERGIAEDKNRREEERNKEEAEREWQQRIQEQQEENRIKAQRELNLSNIRFNAYTEISKEMQSLQFYPLLNRVSQEVYFGFRFKISVLQGDYGFLFPILLTDEVKEKLEEMEKFVSDEITQFYVLNDNTLLHRSGTDYIKYIEQAQIYNGNKLYILNQLQKQMIN